MQAVTLADEVSLTPADDLFIDVEPEGAAPADGTNLAVRAARAFAALQGAPPHVRIGLHKSIPVAAGLAGGSADAAAVLVGMNDLWRAGVSRKGLERIASGLGSDVPFCVRGGTALVEGGGELLVSLGVRAPMWWVLGISDRPLATADVYRRFDERGGGSLGDPHGLADALARGDLERVAAEMRNDLQSAATDLAPSIAAGGDVLRGAGALAVMISGSGPTWLGLARDEQHARTIAAATSEAFVRVEVVSSQAHGPRITQR